MTKQQFTKYAKAIQMLDFQESAHCFDALVIQMDLCSLHHRKELVTNVVVNAIDKARELTK